MLTPDRHACDLLDPGSVRAWASSAQPGMIIHCAAATGGVAWNAAHGYEAFRDNLLMVMHLVDAAVAYGVQHITHVSTSIAYPADAPVPFKESALWTGRPGGPTSGYAHAKRIGQVVLEHAAAQHGLCSAVVMPANVYGAGARMESDRSNVVAAMVRRFVEAGRRGATSVTCWGTGAPMREFIHVSDVAEGVVRAAERIDIAEPINLGTGIMCSVRELALMVASAADWSGSIEWDASKPDGVPEVCCDVTRMQELLSWGPCTQLEKGLCDMVSWYRAETAQDS